MELMIDPLYLIFGLGGVTLLLFVLVIICLIKLRKLHRKYDLFMRGKDAESLEDTIMEQLEDIARLKAEDRANKDLLRAANKQLRACSQKFGMVKYNAFQGMGGNMSFAFALLDHTNTGFLINSVHGREGCYLYIKNVDRGQTDVLLGAEEKKALEKALGY